MLSAMLAACGGEISDSGRVDASGARALVILHSSRLDGEIEPCGCPRNPMGGLTRRNKIVVDHRAGSDVVAIDAGASLDVPRHDPNDRDLPQRRLKAELIVDALKLGGLDAMALGADDWGLGADWLRQMLVEKQAPVLAANLWCDGARPWPGSVVVERGGRRVGLVGVTLGEVEGCEVRDPHTAMKEAAAALGEVDLRVGLIPAVTDREVVAVVGSGLDLDLLFVATGKHSGARPDEHQGIWTYGSGSRGKHLGVLRVEWEPGADRFVPVGHEEEAQRAVERVEGLIRQQEQRLAEAPEAQRARIESTLETYRAQLAEHRAALEGAGASGHGLRNLEVPLHTTLPEHEATRAMVDRTFEAIRELETPSQLRGLRYPHRIPDNPHWAGSDTCASCHRAEHAQWAATAHARAWQTLVDENREMDATCFSCHATGVGQEGGPTAPAEVRSFRDVQCEACHGPAKAHVQDPTAHKPVRDPSPQVCTTCHDGDRDGGRFDDATYRPRIVHPAK